MATIKQKNLFLFKKSSQHAWRRDAKPELKKQEGKHVNVYKDERRFSSSSRCAKIMLKYPSVVVISYSMTIINGTS